MRKLIAFVASAAFVAAMITPLVAQTRTLTGEVVDVACATKKAPGGKGADHAGCATACAKKGLAAGIMTSDNTIYTITGDYAANNNAKLIDFVAKRVEVTGTVTEKDGTRTIAVTSIKAAQ